MDSIKHYADLSERELESAKSAQSSSERFEHLESAFRFAQLAVLASRRRGNVIPFRRRASGNCG